MCLFAVGFSSSDVQGSKESSVCFPTQSRKSMLNVRSWPSSDFFRLKCLFTLCSFNPCLYSFGIDWPFQLYEIQNILKVSPDWWWTTVQAGYRYRQKKYRQASVSVGDLCLPCIWKLQVWGNAMNITGPIHTYIHYMTRIPHATIKWTYFCVVVLETWVFLT